MPRTIHLTAILILAQALACADSEPRRELRTTQAANKGEAVPELDPEPAASASAALLQASDCTDLESWERTANTERT